MLTKDAAISANAVEGVPSTAPLKEAEVNARRYVHKKMPNGPNERQLRYGAKHADDALRWCEFCHSDAIVAQKFL